MRRAALLLSESCCTKNAVSIWDACWSVVFMANSCKNCGNQANS